MNIAYQVGVIVVSLALLAVSVWLSALYPRQPRDHLCQIAEISPDMTPAEKERCRMLRAYKEGKTL